MRWCARSKTGGGKAVACLGDVADAAAMERMAATAAERFGRIDCLVNNAALRREKAFDQMTLAEWREMMGVILEGAFNCAKACLPQLKRSGAAAIVNIGGLSAHTGAKDRAHVVTAKAGLVGFTRALAHDLAADNVTVNLVSPGLVATAREPRQPGAAASRDPRHAARHARHLGGDGADRAVPVRPGRALHHRADHPRERRGLSRVVNSSGIACAASKGARQVVREIRHLTA